MNLDQKQPGFPAEILPNYFQVDRYRAPHHQVDTYSIVRTRFPRARRPARCVSRLRRGIIYRTAKELGANKIAPWPPPRRHGAYLVPEPAVRRQGQGHAAKLVTDDKSHIVIRPLAYCAEADIAKFARGMEFRSFLQPVRFAENMQRQKIREMMQDWDKRYPGRTGRCSLPCRTSCHPTWPTSTCSISAA